MSETVSKFIPLYEWSGKFFECHAEDATRKQYLAKHGFIYIIDVVTNIRHIEKYVEITLGGSIQDEWTRCTEVRSGALSFRHSVACKNETDMILIKLSCEGAR